MANERQSERRTILRNSPLPGGVGPTQTHLYMDGTKLMGQQYDGVAKTIIDFSAIPATTPVGSMTQYGGDAAPSGWLMCDGDHLNSVGTYADLFAVLGYVYGRTDSSGADDAAGTYFQVPDCRGRVPIHPDASQPLGGIDTLGSKAGNNNASTLNHSHTASLDSPNWDGYLQAHEHFIWPITDLASPQNNSTGSFDTTIGLSAYGAGTDCTVRDGATNAGWHETYTGEWGSSEGTCGNQASDGDQFGVSAYATGYPKIYHHHSDSAKSYTMKVSGTVSVGNTGSGAGVGGNLQPFIVTNTIIRYA